MQLKNAKMCQCLKLVMEEMLLALWI